MSENNFPSGAGIASSAAAFAALALAASEAAGLHLSGSELSRLARRGSGSACRSIPGGFVEWQAGEDDLTSYAFSIAQPNHWSMVDCIAIVSQEHKPTGSAQGQALAHTSLLQAPRLADAPRRLEICRRAILDRDFSAFAEVVEQDSNLMHAGKLLKPHKHLHDINGHGPVARLGVLELVPWVDCFVAFAWQGGGGERLLVTTNYAPNQSQCYVRLPFADLEGSRWRLHDQMEGVVYDRDGRDLSDRGLYLDVPPWQTSVFGLTRTLPGS